MDRCYRPEPFRSERHRVEYVFTLYEQLTIPLVGAAKPVRKAWRMQAGPQQPMKMSRHERWEKI